MTVNKRENVSTVCSGAAVLSTIKKVPRRTHRPNRKKKNIYIYCGEVEGSHDKESSINTPEGGFIHKRSAKK